MCRIVSAMILCSLRGTNLTNVTNIGALAENMTTPFAVSIVISSCRRPVNLIRIADLRQRSRDHRGDVTYAMNFSICVPPIFGNFDDVSDLVEFVEVNRVLGAQKFHLYVDSVGPRVAPCIHEYARRGIIEIQPWILPPDIAHVIYYHGQILATNECLYRLMYRTKYLIIQDLDEFVVPMRFDNWPSMLDNINKHTQTDSDRIASYNFRNRFFPPMFQISSNFTPANSVERRFKTLTVTQADKKLFPFTDRSKVIARPERLIIWHIHEILDSSLVRNKDTNARVSTEHGQLFHYRRGVTVTSTITVSRMLEFKQSILRRVYVATAAICLTGDYVYS